MKAEKLNEIEAAAAKATRGPWKMCPRRVYFLAPDGSPVCDITDFETYGPIELRGHGAEVSGNRPAGSMDANADFICGAREWVPQLVAHVRLLEQRLQDEYEGRTRALKERNAALARVRDLMSDRA
jgi:hypothetical protein